MRPALAVLILASVLAGCYQKVPAPKPPRPPDTPSSLVLVPSKQTGPDSLFGLPSDKLYVVNGTWKSHADPKKGEYDRPGEFTVEKADNADVDPKEEIVPFINRWVEAAKVRVINQYDAPASPEQIKRSFDYRTERTDGTLIYVLQPAVPAKKITISIEAHERRR
jgi:hypothetical protein